MRSKWIKNVIIIGTFCLSAVSTWATSKVELPKEFAYVSQETTWEESYDAPALKVTITDAYLKAGKEERFIVALENATWTNGGSISITPYNLSGITSTDLVVMPKDDEKIEVRLNIPGSIKKGEEVSLTIPLVVRTEADEMYVIIEEIEETELVEEGKWLFAAKTNKQATWQVQEIPTFVKEGTIAPIKITEVRAGAIGSGEIAIELKLQNDNLAFGEPQYISKQVNTDDTDYVLDASKYLEYTDGFQGATENLRFKVSHKSDKTILLRVNGTVPMKAGSVLIKNLPIVNTNGNVVEEDVKVTITGNTLVGSQKDVVVAHIVKYTEEGKDEQKEEETVKEEQEAIDNRSVQFKIGESSYAVKGEKYIMTGAPYIQNPGYTMIPVRYVAMAFGVPESDISFVNGVAVFKYGDKIIELTSGSKIARVNKAEVQMQTELVIKEGRVYAPIGEVAKILGITKSWDGISQTATFTN